jgi:hypothetical protein
LETTDEIYATGRQRRRYPPQGDNRRDIHHRETTNEISNTRRQQMRYPPRETSDEISNIWR